MTEEMKKDHARYLAAMHAVQTGIAHAQNLGSQDGTPKHLRVGITSTQVTDAAVARLLIDKGIFTDAEYVKAIADEAEREKLRYEKELGVTLA